jgi:hypothetical protein
MAAILVILTNAVPVLGVAFLTWDPTYILILYWAESVMIGFFNVIMMTTSSLAGHYGGSTAPVQRFGGIGLPGFFILHYGLFMAVQGLFIIVLFWRGRAPVLSELLSPHGYLPALVVMLVSQLYSFLWYFVRQRQYLHTKPEDLMFRPYPRVFIMQVTIILGAFVMTGTGWHLGPIVIWVAAKTAVDLLMSSRAIRRSSTP